MKKIVFLMVAFAMTSSLWAQVDLVKRCESSFVIPELGDFVLGVDARVFKHQGQYVSLVRFFEVGEKGEEVPAKVTYFEGAVREGLDRVDYENDVETIGSLSMVEKVIAISIIVSQAEGAGKYVKPGMNLGLIRHAQIYILGDFESLGDIGDNLVVVEAKGEQGASLGTFVMGFGISACK